MIYVISEDYYFAVGIIEILKITCTDALHLSYKEFEHVNDQISLDDIVLICSKSKKYSLSLTCLARITDVKFVFFLDTIVEKKTLKSIYVKVMSKKSKKEELLEVLQELKNGSRTNPISLSRQEVIIMDMLVQQHDPYRIAKTLRLSVKTVCAHKMNALRKLGLHHLNARSLLLYEHVFQHRVE